MKKIILVLFLTYLTISYGDIAIVSLAVGEEYIEQVRLGIENKQMYCEQQGYDFIFSETSLDTSRHPAWSKILLVLQAMENPEYEWIVWIDADTLIMNQGIRLERFIDEKYKFIISRDIGGINSGVFFIKNCDEARQFLERAYTHTEFLTHGWYEQLAIITEIHNSDFNGSVKIVPQRLFNAYPAEFCPNAIGAYQTGDFIIHFAGANAGWEGYLKSLFIEYAPEVIHNPDAFTLE